MGEASLGERAEALAARGDFAGAVALLEKLAAQAPDDPANWLKIAGLQRAGGNPVAALESVYRALAIQPLEFTALLMRASLLHKLGDPLAGEA